MEPRELNDAKNTSDEDKLTISRYFPQLSSTNSRYRGDEESLIRPDRAFSL